MVDKWEQLDWLRSRGDAAYEARNHNLAIHCYTAAIMEHAGIVPPDRVEATVPVGSRVLAGIGLEATSGFAMVPVSRVAEVAVSAKVGGSLQRVHVNRLEVTSVRRPYEVKMRFNFGSFYLYTWRQGKRPGHSVRVSVNVPEEEIARNAEVPLHNALLSPELVTKPDISRRLKSALYEGRALPVGHHGSKTWREEVLRPLAQVGGVILHNPSYLRKVRS